MAKSSPHQLPLTDGRLSSPIIPGLHEPFGRALDAATALAPPALLAEVACGALDLLALGVVLVDGGLRARQ